MARMSLRYWLNWMPRLRQRRAGRPRGRHRCRSALEGLEGRCLPSTVTNRNDTGPGSLREALATTPAGGTVDFQPGLTGTLTLTSGELLVSTDLTITGPGADGITITSNYGSRLVEIAPKAAVALAGLTLTGGSNPGGTGGGLLNAGVLTLADVTVSDNTSALGGGIYNATGGTLTLAAPVGGVDQARLGLPHADRLAQSRQHQGLGHVVVQFPADDAA